MSENISLREAKVQRWRELLAQQAASGKSIRVFCFERQIGRSMFEYWRLKFSRTGEKADKPSRFISVAPGDFKSATPRIALPNGVTIDLGCGLDSPSANQFLLQLCGVGLSGGRHAKS